MFSKEEIEANIPSFLWYKIVDDPLEPSVYFRFGDYYLRITSLGMLQAVNGYLRDRLPKDHRVLWDWLAAGTTTSEVIEVSSNYENVALDGINGEMGEAIPMIHLRLRDRYIKAVYISERDMIVYNEPE